MPYEGAGFYRHYKGGYYYVKGLALQEDTVVKPGQLEHALAGPEVTFVIYQPLTPGSLLVGRAETYWARELEDFNALVSAGPPLQQPRFRRLRWYQALVAVAWDLVKARRKA